MKEYRDLIISLFEDLTIAPYTYDEILEQTNINDELLKSELQSLIDEGIIYETKKHRFGLLKQFNMYKGKIEIKDKGFGFITSPDFEDDFFVAKDDTLNAFDKDEVIFRILSNSDNFSSASAIVVKVVKRNTLYIVGKLEQNYHKLRFIPMDCKMDYYFDITDYNMSVVGDVVRIKIDQFLGNNIIKCHVDSILGNINDIGIDIKAIASKYNFYQEFNNETLLNLKEVVNDYTTSTFDKETSRRTKINKRIITIDGDDAKDLDDAVSITLLENSNYELGVYIADVSFFVKEDSFIDKEALQRGCSCYLVDRVIPMLPHKLSNDLCSLNEKTPKLVICCTMEINRNGEVVNYSIEEAVIETLHRMTYNNVNKILMNDSEIKEKYKDIVDDIYKMRDLSNILSSMRSLRGALDFNIPEAKIIISPDGEVDDIVLRERLEAEKIIEEFMLIANETVAKHINSLELPFIYRIHDKPNIKKIERFNKIFKNTEYKIQTKNISKISSKILQRILNDASTNYAVSTMLLRMMAKAKYDAINVGHYGLASSCYTHFTSPIRRYPDLLVHRLLRKYLFEGNVDVQTQNKYQSRIEEIALISSERERNAIDCEYEVNDLKMVEHMKNHIGEEYNGIISSITKFGMFVTLPNTIEGLVRVGSIKDDYYIYNENQMALIGERKGKVYKIGDKVKVKVLSSNKEKKEIDFTLSLKNNNNMIKYSKARDYHEKRRYSSRRKK